MPARLPLALLALACLPLPALAEDIPGSEFASGYWNGRAWADDAGNLVDCYVSTSYTSGEVLTLSLTPDDLLTIYLSAEGTRFVPGDAYNALLMTEVGYPVAGQTFSPNEAYVGFSLAGIDASIDYLTQGSYLRLYGVGIDQAFDVRGIGGALALARACLLQNSGPAVAASAPEAPARPALGKAGDGSKPAQLAVDIATFRRQHLPCLAETCP
jgi:hypothetical protein